MPQFAELEEVEQFLGAGFFLLVPLLSTLLLGLLAAGAMLGPRRASLLFGLVELVVGLLCLAGLAATAPHLWWAAAIPIAAGAAVLRARSLHAAGQSWFRFGLVDLLALVLFGGLLLAGITSQVRQTEVERAAADELARLPGATSNQVHWQFGRVRGVLFFSPLDPPGFEAAADALEKLSQLRTLQIGENTLPGSALQRIGRLTTLRSLSAQSLPVTDDDLRSLSGLTNLEVLDIDGRQLTDAGLKHLYGLKRLRVLHLYKAGLVSPQAMDDLYANLPRLDP